MYHFLKRMMDLVIALLAFILLSWFLVPCMLILWCTGEHAVWYLSERVGKNCKPFKIIKFATMLRNAPNLGTGDITVRHDPRVLPFGRFLRKTKINELPQIFNVIIGNMSIVGPRPLVRKGFNHYASEDAQKIFVNTPGITGIGSIIFRDEEFYLSKTEDPKLFYHSKVMPYKASLELWYADHASLFTDFKLIFLTAWVIVFPTSDLPYKILKNVPERPEWMQ